MKEIIEAHKLLSDLDEKDIYEVARDFEKYSRQIIGVNIISDFIILGLSNIDFLFSDFLNKYGLKNLAQLKDI